MPESFSEQYMDTRSIICDSLKERAYKYVDNGSWLEKNWFPTKEKKFDVFISHSHKDIELVQSFASWLNEKLGLTCFIDALCWENADDLLDFLYRCCPYYIFLRRRYACELREELTSHVHAMLSVALMKMMDQTECVIFVKSDNSLTRWESQTMSPWLYEETNFANLLRTNVPERLKRRVADSTRSFGLELLRENYVRLLYDVNFERFGNLYLEQLRTIYGQELHGEDALDAIYRSHEAFRKYVRD